MSVLQLINVFAHITGREVPYVVKPRRDGDIVAMYANGALAKEELGWESKYDLQRMCKSGLRHKLSPSNLR